MRTYAPPKTLSPSTEAVGYIRLSKEHGETNLSLAGMREDIEALALRLGYTLIKVYFDDGVSGAVRNRPDFHDWLNEGRQGRHLLTWSGDRLSREGVNVAGMVLDVIEGKDPETGEKNRNPVRFCDVHGMDSAKGDSAFRWTFVIKSEVAREVREDMARRAIATSARLRQARRWRGGSVPYGYKVVSIPEGGKTLDIDEDQAEVILGMAHRVLDEGASCYQLAKELNGAGYPAVRRKNSHGWSHFAVKQILTGESALGRATHRGKVIREADGTRVPVQFWPAILTTEVSERLRGKLLNSPERGARRHRAGLLSGLVVCGGCGGPLYVKGEPHQHYFCAAASSPHQGKRHCPTRCSTQVRYIDTFVTEQFLATYVNRNGGAEYLKRATNLRDSSELIDVERVIKETLDAINDIDPDEDDGELQTHLRDLKRKRKVLEAAGPAEVERWEPTGMTVRQAWDSADTAGRRELLRDYLDGKIVLKPATRGSRRGFDDTRVQIPWRKDLAAWARIAAEPRIVRR